MAKRKQTSRPAEKLFADDQRDLFEKSYEERLQAEKNRPVECLGMKFENDEFERDVFIKLVEKGYNVTSQVKVSASSIDMVVEGENDRRLAIELDGDKYHPPEKWMEDWKRQRIMERVDWQFWRCWGSSYTIDPNGCIDDLMNVLNSMQILPCKSSSAANIYTESRVYEKEIEPQVYNFDFELAAN